MLNQQLSSSKTLSKSQQVLRIDSNASCQMSDECASVIQRYSQQVPAILPHSISFSIFHITTCQAADITLILIQTETRVVQHILPTEFSFCRALCDPTRAAVTATTEGQLAKVTWSLFKVINPWDIWMRHYFSDCFAFFLNWFEKMVWPQYIFLANWSKYVPEHDPKR